jgi:hypothetical protein
MPDYKGIQGTAVQNFAGDPTNPIIGQVWYNSLSGKFRYNEVAPQLGAWSTGGSLNTARGLFGGAGTQTAALTFGGDANPPYPAGLKGETESYNGTTWTELNNLNTARSVLMGVGATNTAALAFGGFVFAPVTAPVANTESWNGTSWTSVNSLNQARQMPGGAGTNTAALAFGGEGPAPVGKTGSTESWNGTSWTTSSCNFKYSKICNGKLWCN